MVSYTGRQPSSRVGNAIMLTDNNMVALRPRVSPSQPNTTEPSGRIRKPAAKTP